MYSCVYSGHILFTIVKMAIGHPHSRSTKVGVPPGRVACVRTSHERTRQIDETFKYFINLAWHRKYKDSMHLAGSRESWRLSPRVNHSQRTTRESASGISSASANETNDDERVNESGERGQFVHFKESFVRTDSFANEPTLLCITCSWGYSNSYGTWAAHSLVSRPRLK